MNGYSTFRQIAAIFLQFVSGLYECFRYRALFSGFSEFVLRDPFGLQMFFVQTRCFCAFGSQMKVLNLKVDADYLPVVCHPRKARSIRRWPTFRMSILRLSHRKKVRLNGFAIQHALLSPCLRRIKGTTMPFDMLVRNRVAAITS